MSLHRTPGGILVPDRGIVRGYNDEDYERYIGKRLPDRYPVIPRVMPPLFPPMRQEAVITVTRTATVIKDATGTITCSFGALPAVGQPVFVTIEVYRNSATPATITTVLDNQIGGLNLYARIGTDKTTTTGSDSQTTSMWLLDKVVTSAGTFTVSATNVGSEFATMTLIEGGGFGASGASLDTGTFASSNGTNTWTAVNAGANNSVASAIVIAHAGVNGSTNTAWSNSSGYTDAGNSPDGTAHEISQTTYLILSATGAQSITWTRGGTMASWAAQIAIFIGAGAAGDGLMGQASL